MMRLAFIPQQRQERRLRMCLALTCVACKGPREPAITDPECSREERIAICRHLSICPCCLSPLDPGGAIGVSDLDFNRIVRRWLSGVLKDHAAAMSIVDRIPPGAAIGAGPW